MSLQIYNTITREKQEFTPITPGKVKMYVCGVTVYDNCHLGHGRAYVAFDIIYRYLKYLGYSIKYVRNITDIDDKIIARANQDKAPLSINEKVIALTKKYTAEFHKDMESLNILPPSEEPKAVEYIPQMIKIIEKLIKDQMAYKIDGDVYFEVSKFKDYGKLSQRSTDELLSGARVEPDKRKKAPLDFCLWKEAKPNEPFWDSPWGKGRPGWHIECSAMSMNLLGEEFDIHGGGQDLIFPHHENEIAQSCGYTGRQPVRYWIHNGFVTINREKMSKSVGNFFTLKEIFAKYEPKTVRYFLISQHYRSPVDFGDQLLEDARHALLRIEDCQRRAEIYLENKKYDINRDIHVEYENKFREAMDDDFNTAKALAVIFDLVKDINNDLAENIDKKKVFTKLGIMQKFLNDVLGIQCGVSQTIFVDKNSELNLSEGDLNEILSKTLSADIIKKIIMARNSYKKNKQWQLADKVRNILVKEGYVLRDTPSSTECIKENV
jgi:cysteinyl-tRNA synthetase